MRCAAQQIRELHHGGPPLGLILVLGGRGSGKTTLLQAMEIHHRVRHGGRSVVWDRLGYWPRRRLRLVVRTPEPEAAALAALPLAPCTLYVDEAHLAFPQPGGPRPGSALWELARVGRQGCLVGPFARRGPVALVCATQRPADVSTGIRALLDRIYVGHYPATALRELEWLGRVLDAEDVGRIPSLTPGQFLVRNLA